MADITTDAPTLLTATRNADGSIRVTWENNAKTGATYGEVSFHARVTGATGAFTRVANVTGSGINTRSYSIYKAPNGAAFLPGVGYDIALRASGPAGQSGYSSSKTVAAMKTATPSIDSATRDSETSGTVIFELTPVAPATVASVYVETRRKGASRWDQVNSTGNGTARQVRVPGMNGAYAYEARLYASGPAGPSGYSGTKEIPAWWQKPPAATNLLAARNPSGTVTLTWAATATAQAPITSWNIYRATGEAGQYALLKKIDGNLRTYTDSTALATAGYRYAVEAVNTAGVSTSRPTVSTDATLFKPNPPSAAPAVAYVATDKATVTWALNTSPTRPYTGQRVKMRTVGATSWSTVAAVGPAVTTTTVTVGANRLVEFVIEPYNGAGSAESTSPVSAKIATTPAIPASLTAKWGTGANILTSWPDFASIGNAIDVEFSTDGGTAAATWYPGTTPSSPLAISARSWQHTSVTVSVPHWYRLRVRRTDIEGAPASAWVYSSQVVAQTKPLVPTIVPPETVDATDTIRLALVHNPVDGTPQTAARIRYRLQGGTTWTTWTLGTATWWDLAAHTYTNGQTIEVQGQTAGASGVYSDWSPSMLVTLRTRPTVTITSPPAGTWVSPTLTVTWTASAQIEAVVELLTSTGELVDSRQVGADVRTVTFAVADRTAYTVRITVKGAYQASLPASVAISVALERPAAPRAWATFRGEDASVLLEAQPIAALQTQRRNIAPALDVGSRTAPSVTAQMISLRHDGGTYEPGLRINATDAQTGMEWHGLDNRADGEMVGGTVMLTTLADTPVAAEVILKVNGSPVYTLPASVPQWPDHVVVQTSPTSTPGAPSIEVVSTMPSTQLVAARVGIIGTRTGSGWSDYFDRDSISDTLVYVATPTGIVLEGLPVAAGGDIPVVSTVRIEYWRSADEGKAWQRVGDGGSDWSLVDETPPLKRRLLYKARAYSATGGWTEGTAFPVDTRACDTYLHYGGQVLRGGWEPSYSGTAGRQSVLRRYVGRDKAAPIFGDRLERTQSYRVTLMDDSTPLAQWVTAAEYAGTVTVRDPGGRVHTGTLTDFAWDDSTEEEQTVAFAVTESEALP